MQHTLTNDYLIDVRDRLGKLKALAEAALDQVSDQDLFTTLDAESNSIALLLKHMAGNMHTRWEGFPQEGESESSKRNRDAEFEIDGGDTKSALLESWDTAWGCAFEAIERLTEDDMNKSVVLRGESMSVISAINRQFTHCAYHIGQIVFLAKHLSSGEWRSLSIPRGESEAFTAAMRKKHEA
jgi:hypothetical protein